MGSIPASRTINCLAGSRRPFGRCLAHLARLDVINIAARLQLSMNLYIWLDTATYLSWRIASYALLNLGEDAALLALMFC
ncbi:MAG: hypothetical protein ABIV07_13545 [Polaromonas sp.]